MGAYVAVRVVEEEFLGEGVGEGSKGAFGRGVGSVSNDRVECRY